MQSTFSGRTGCLHAALVAVVFAIVLGVTAAALQRGSEAVGRLAGTLVFAVAPLGFLASYLFQRGWKLLAAGLVVVVWSAVPVFLFIGARHLEVSEAEKEHLDVFSDSIRHRDFGFSLPNPGKSFHLVALPPAMAAILANEPVGRESFVWVFRNEDSSEVAMVFVLKALNTVDEQTFRSFTHGLRGRLVLVKDAQLLEDTLVWVPGMHGSRLGIRMRTGMYGKMRCVASLSAPLVCVCAQTWTSDSNGLDFVRAGLAFGHPPSR